MMPFPKVRSECKSTPHLPLVNTALKAVELAYGQHEKVGKEGTKL